ncbi:hypothetical protein [Bacillus licheniformis]|uniref:hypothetical protein n=1 Tax=Bacillus licheniformis TaxID=1402 RepID=UPI0008FB5C28|nr:hypothetical protein [Bacillus licheniformis]OIS74628.1 hypothetical protein A4A40_18820 [Bacillus licheniformis]OIS80653.1 hypothetical protein A4A43_09605 [Bacillus licheniformis]OIS82236.1 hypothetical protein A4A38_05570 [Bacillus licheniformis]OIS89971.1 hypothetical protein A4A42_00115 [Bacillus licheniformis]WCO63711.1 hypothetical protein OSR41_05020 [Bacillus licheniformis]
MKMTPGVGDYVEVLGCSYGGRDIFIGKTGEIVEINKDRSPAIYKVRVRFEWINQVWWFKSSELRVLKKGLETIPTKLNSRYVAKAFWVGHKKMMEEKVKQLEEDCKKAGRELLLALCDGSFNIEGAIYWHEQCRELFAMYTGYKEKLEKAKGVVGAEDEKLNSDDGAIQE